MLRGRRKFLGAALGAAAAVAAPTIFIPKLARAWGEREEGIVADPPYKVLEIFLYGGLSPWETFYVRSDGSYVDWFDAQSAFNALPWCSTGPAPLEVQLRGADSLGKNVWLGPSTKPLWSFADRLRTLVVRHNLKPHEAAIPYAMTGMRLGNPRLAGLGAHIQRYASTTPALEIASARPRSYVLLPGRGVTDTERLVATTACGVHPGSARPLTIRLGDGASFIAGLQRSGMTAEHDRLIDVYRDQYRRDLRWGGTTVTPEPEQHRLLRGNGFQAYQAAIEGVLHADALEDIFDSPSRIDPTTTSSCGSFSGLDYTRRGIQLAGHLFRNDARYVGVVDIGLADEDGYDAHTNHPALTSYNLHAMLTALREAVSGASPLIDLDETLVVLNTEFGRTPAYDGGRDHHPEGYVVSLLGGPIGRTVGSSPRANAGVSGAMDDNGYAVDLDGAMPIGHTMTDVMGAVLLAAGVDPRAPEIFGASDFSAAILAAGDGHRTTSEKLAEVILGLGT